MSLYPLFREPEVTHLESGQIGGLSQAHNDTSDALKGSLVSLQADTARVITRACGCGRVLAGNAATDADTAPRAGTGLTVLLQAGYEAIIEGQPFVVDDPGGAMILSGAPASAPSWLYLHRVDGEFEPEWESAERPDLVADGIPCLGLVTAGAETLTIDLAHETTIAPLHVLRDTVVALLSRVTLLEGSAGEGTGTSGGFAYAGSAPWLAAPGDDRATSVVIQAQRDDDAATMRLAVADLEARLRDYIENGTDLREELVMQTSNEWQIEALIRLLSKLTEVNTHAPEWLEVAMVKFGTFGHAPDGAPPPAIGINDTPNELLFSTLQIDGEGASP